MSWMTEEVYTNISSMVVWVSADKKSRANVGVYLWTPNEEELEELWNQLADECKTRHELASFLSGDFVIEEFEERLRYDRGEEDIPF